MLKILLTTFILFHFIACTNKNENEVWIYTSLYKDTIADIEPLLQKDFPNLIFKFYQAGSEEVAAKVNAEILAGGTKADILISSDRFWYEEMASENYLQAYVSPRVQQIPSQWRHLKGYYNTLSIPAMVIVYNNEVLDKKNAPQKFSDFLLPKWKGQISTGSPLASGTNFTTIAFLSKTYGWDFFKKLQRNKVISEGGNSAVLRRIQNKERPIGWVLLENVLRFQGKDKRLVTVFPEDGVVLQNNVLAITKKEKRSVNIEAVAGWLFNEKGQKAMTRSFMYSPFADIEPPDGAPSLTELQKKAFPWSVEFVDYVVKNREKIKENMTESLFNEH